MSLQVIRRAEEVWRDDEGLAAIRDRIDFAAGGLLQSWCAFMQHAATELVLASLTPLPTWSSPPPP